MQSAEALNLLLLLAWLGPARPGTARPSQREELCFTSASSRSSEKHGLCQRFTACVGEYYESDISPRREVVDRFTDFRAAYALDVTG